MLPVEILDLCLGHGSKRLVDIDFLAALIVSLEEEQKANGEQEDGRGCSEIQPVTDAVIWTVDQIGSARRTSLQYDEELTHQMEGNST